MMGVGKSTIGKILARKLKFKFLDIDKIIEMKEKFTIKHIFESKGENYFRKIEKKITLDQIKKNNTVVALGGGAFLDSSIRKEVKNTCISFWLDLNIESLILRLKNAKKRPLLDENNFEDSINKIYASRKKIYNEADFKIKCNSLDKSEVVEKIINLYENTRNKI